MVDWKAWGDQHEQYGNDSHNDEISAIHHTLALICRALAELVPQEMTEAELLRGLDMGLGPFESHPVLEGDEAK